MYLWKGAAEPAQVMFSSLSSAVRKAVNRSPIREEESTSPSSPGGGHVAPYVEYDVGVGVKKLVAMEAVHGTEKEVSINGEKQKIKIPAGVDTGSRIRFEKYDIVIDVKPDSRFVREGSDIVSDTDISFTQAALGAEISVTTIDGEIKIRIPEGTQPGTLIRLNGRGIPHLRGSGRGSHYVRVKVVVPKKLNRQQKELLEAFQKEEIQGKKNWF